MRMENRFRMLEMSQPDVARELFRQAQVNVEERWEYYQYLASRPYGQVEEEAEGEA
jgi:pyruvate-ferredoxin/flavodoxin oxidoreductase